MSEIEIYSRFILTLTLSMVRIGAAFSSVPFLSSKVVPGMARSGIILSLTLIVYPLVAPTVPAASLEILQLFVILAKEILLGILIGFLAGIPFWIAESVGFLIDQQSGSGMAELFDPTLGGSSSALGVFVNQSMLVLFFSAGGFLIFLGAIFESYHQWPILSFYPKLQPLFAYYMIEHLNNIFKMIVLLASPIVLVMFLTDFILGLINRFAQQLNVFFLAMSIKSVIALTLLLFYMGTIYIFLRDQWLNQRKLELLFNGILS